MFTGSTPFGDNNFKIIYIKLVLYKMSLTKINLNLVKYLNSTSEKQIDEKNDDGTASITQNEIKTTMDTSRSILSMSSPSPSPRMSEAVYDKNYRTTADHIPLGLETNMPTPRKKVRFSKTVRVVCIPCRSDFCTMSRYSTWWSVADIDSFKEHAFEEMRQFITFHGCSIKDGLSRLYQPTEEDLAFSK